MDIELKTALEAHGKALDAAIEKYEGQIKEQGKASDEIRAEVKSLSEKFEASLTEIAQKMEKRDDSPVIITAGQELVNSAQFKSLAAGQCERFRLELKNTVISDGTTAFPHQKPGIIPGNFLPLTVRQVIPSVPVTGNAVNSLREKTWTNNAAERAQTIAKPESVLEFENYDVTIQTVAHFIKVSNQLLADAPAIAAYIDTRLRDGLAQRVDAQLVNGNGTSPNLSGLARVGNHTAYTPTAGHNLVDAINKAKYAMWATGNMPDCVMVNPADWGAMEIAKTDLNYLYGAPGTNAPMNPFGLRIVLSNHVAAGKFFVCAMNTSAVVYNRQGAVVEMGYVNDDFTKNLVTIRAEERLALGTERPQGILYGNFTA